MSIALHIDGEKFFVSTKRDVLTCQHDDDVYHALDGFAGNCSHDHDVSFQELITSDNAEVSVDGIAIDPFKHFVVLHGVVLERVAFPIDGDDITGKLALDETTQG
jgi:hypothetical protein